MGPVLEYVLDNPVLCVGAFGAAVFAGIAVPHLFAKRVAEAEELDEDGDDVTGAEAVVDAFQEYVPGVGWQAAAPGHVPAGAALKGVTDPDAADSDETPAQVPAFEVVPPAPTTGMPTWLGPQVLAPAATPAVPALPHWAPELVVDTDALAAAAAAFTDVVATTTAADPAVTGAPTEEAEDTQDFHDDGATDAPCAQADDADLGDVEVPPTGSAPAAEQDMTDGDPDEIEPDTAEAPVGDFDAELDAQGDDQEVATANPDEQEAESTEASAAEPEAEWDGQDDDQDDQDDQDATDGQAAARGLGNVDELEPAAETLAADPACAPGIQGGDAPIVAVEGPDEQSAEDEPYAPIMDADGAQPLPHRDPSHAATADAPEVAVLPRRISTFDTMRTLSGTAPEVDDTPQTADFANTGAGERPDDDVAPDAPDTAGQADQPDTSGDTLTDAPAHPAVTQDLPGAEDAGRAVDDVRAPATCETVPAPAPVPAGAPLTRRQRRELERAAAAAEQYAADHGEPPVAPDATDSHTFAPFAVPAAHAVIHGDQDAPVPAEPLWPSPALGEHDAGPDDQATDAPQLADDSVTAEADPHVDAAARQDLDDSGAAADSEDAEPVKLGWWAARRARKAQKRAARQQPQDEPTPALDEWLPSATGTNPAPVTAPWAPLTDDPDTSSAPVTPWTMASGDVPAADVAAVDGADAAPVADPSSATWDADPVNQPTQDDAASAPAPISEAPVTFPFLAPAPVDPLMPFTASRDCSVDQTDDQFLDADGGAADTHDNTPGGQDGPADTSDAQALAGAPGELADDVAPSWFTPVPAWNPFTASEPTAPDADLTDVPDADVDTEDAQADATADEETAVEAAQPTPAPAWNPFPAPPEVQLPATAQADDAQPDSEPAGPTDGAEATEQDPAAADEEAGPADSGMPWFAAPPAWNPLPTPLESGPADQDELPSTAPAGPGDTVAADAHWMSTPLPVVDPLQQPAPAPDASAEDTLEPLPAWWAPSVADQVADQAPAAEPVDATTAPAWPNIAATSPTWEGDSAAGDEPVTAELAEAAGTADDAGAWMAGAAPMPQVDQAPAEQTADLAFDDIVGAQPQAPTGRGWFRRGRAKATPAEVPADPALPAEPVVDAAAAQELTAVRQRLSEQDVEVAAQHRQEVDRRERQRVEREERDRTRRAEAARRDAERHQKALEAQREAARTAAARQAAAAEREAARTKRRAERDAAREARKVRGRERGRDTDDLRAAAEALLTAAATTTPAVSTELGQATAALPAAPAPAAPSAGEDISAFVIGSSTRSVGDVDHVAFDLPEALPRPLSGPHTL